MDFSSMYPLEPSQKGVYKWSIQKYLAMNCCLALAGTDSGNQELKQQANQRASLLFPLATISF